MPYMFAPPTIDVPEVTKPVTYIGPSFHRQRSAPGGIEHTAVLWVGGKGLAEDGRWGKLFTVILDIPHGVDLAETIKEAFLTGRDKVVEAYGEEAAEAIGLALVATHTAKPIPRPMTLEEVKEFTA